MQSGWSVLTTSMLVIPVEDMGYKDNRILLRSDISAKLYEQVLLEIIFALNHGDVTREECNH